jgi:hypothetical protein
LIELYVIGIAICFIATFFVALTGKSYSASQRFEIWLSGFIYAVIFAPVWPLVLIWYVWTKHNEHDEHDEKI